MTDDQFNILITKLDDLHGDFREFKGETTVKVERLESDAASTQLWGNIKTFLVIPITLTIREIGEHFHLLK